MIRRFRLEILLDYVALGLCIIIFLFSLPGVIDLPIAIVFIFYLVIPGYAITRVYFPNLPTFEKVVVIIAISISISTFMQSFLEAFVYDIKVSGLLILNVISSILISYAIICNRYQD